jgi:transforming growth factor-beta-induced protein
MRITGDSICPSTSKELISMKTSLLIVAALAAVLATSSAASVTLRQSAHAEHGMAQNIVQEAAADPQLSTLVSLVKKAGLVTALSNPNVQLTVFAPTNAAFSALKKADPMTFNSVVTTPSLLKKILTYHVLATKVNATTATAVATKNGSVKTLEGEKIKLSTKAGKLLLNGSAEVVKANVAATNGVIHVINGVIVPPSVKVAG